MKNQKIKRENIIISNIDEYIRQEKKRLLEMGNVRMLDDQRFYWNQREWAMITYFVSAATCEVFYGKGGIELKEGMLFMGARHFKLKV